MPEPINLEIIYTLGRTIRELLDAVPQGINQRPAFPAIKIPDSGAVINGSQTQTTPLPVQISSNRPELPHSIDLLDADDMTPYAEGTITVTPSTTTTATFHIPILTAAGRKTYLLQCRCPGSIAGNVHRILIDIGLPVAPPAPTISLSAMANAAALPPGDVPNPTPGLSAVAVTATVVGGVANYTFNWTVSRTNSMLMTTSTPFTTTSMTNTSSLPSQDYLAGGPPFPIAVAIDCTVVDGNGASATAPTLRHRIT